MIIEANGIKLYCQIDAPATANADLAPVLLIGGLGFQAPDWDGPLVDGIVSAGYQVIRYDNRDSGHSTYIESSVDLAAIAAGDFSTVRYGLSDLVDDVVGLLGALEIDRVHVVGHSMGAMIAQSLAIQAPSRVATLTSIAGTTGARGVGQAHPGIPELLMPAFSRPATAEERLEAALSRSLAWSSMDKGVTVEVLAQRARRRVQRSAGTGGSDRQLAAVLTAPDRTPALATLEVPTLVIHGADDPLIDVSGGRATADAIPEARLMIMDGVKHDIPPVVLPDVVDAIVAHLSRAR